jgi:LuxR family quorum sensing-dependent transcriptional regulator
MPPDFWQDAYSFIEGLGRLSAPDEVLDSMTLTLARFGFENYIVAGLDPQRRFDEQVLSHRWPLDYFAQYTSENYHIFSPTARWCRWGTRPFEWSGASFSHERDPRSREVVHVAAQFRIKSGFIVPVHGPNGYAAAVKMSGVDVKIPAPCKPAIHLMALYAFDHMRRLIGATSKDMLSLSHREQEVMAWMARGKSTCEIGEILHIAKRTVDFHTQAACHKLGAKNRTHAVAIALRNRIFDL